MTDKMKANYVNFNCVKINCTKLLYVALRCHMLPYVALSCPKVVWFGLVGLWLSCGFDNKKIMCGAFAASLPAYKIEPRTSFAQTYRCLIYISCYFVIFDIWVCYFLVEMLKYINYES